MNKKNINLINARKVNEMTLREVAEELDVLNPGKYISVYLISDWEHGRRNLSVAYAKNMGEIFDVGFEKFL